jgi:hypothetical protein
MAIIVDLEHKGPNEVMDIVREIRAQGLVQGKDFDFAYHPAEEDWMNGTHTARFTRFTFYNEKWGTWFSLKW